MSLRRKKDREKAIRKFWMDQPGQDIDVITDVVDRGSHIKVTSCTSDVTAWWLGTLRTVYPQDHCSGKGDRIKMHPEVGVTLQLSKDDGTLRIKGKKHLQWFKDNFEHLLANGDKELAAATELGKVIDLQLKLNDGYTVGDLEMCDIAWHGR